MVSFLPIFLVSSSSLSYSSKGFSFCHFYVPLFSFCLFRNIFRTFSTLFVLILYYYTHYIFYYIKFYFSIPFLLFLTYKSHMLIKNLTIIIEKHLFKISIKNALNLFFNSKHYFYNSPPSK